MDESAASSLASHLARVVELVPAMLAYWDRDLRCRFANPAYAHWFGVDPQRLIGTSMRELLGPDLFARSEPYILGALGGEAQLFERLTGGPDGVQRHNLANYLPDLQNGVVVGLVTHVAEVSSIKHDQERLQESVRRLEAEVHMRRSAEEGLRDTQQNLAVTLASIGAGYVATDRAGCVTAMNAVAERVTGWSAAQARGQSVWTVFQREDRPPEYLALNPVEVMIAQQITVDTAHHVVAISRDGQRTLVEVKADLTRAADGTVRGMFFLFRDLTGQQRAEVVSNRLAAIVESSSDAIIGKTLDGRITDWNRGAEALLGYSAEEAIGRPVQMLIPAEREAEEMRILADLARGESVPAFDTMRRAKDGSLREVSISISPIRDAAGRIVGASKIARDMSRQRRAEAALRESEARLRFTMEAAQIGEWELDFATGKVHRSLQHARCFGYDRVEGDWTFDIFLAHVHPEDRADAEHAFRRGVQNRRNWRIECRVVWADGSVHWINSQASIIHDGQRPLRALGIVSDVTQQRMAEQERLTAQRLEAENRQILEASRLKSLFLANMSHELRTPLNAIIGFADLLHAGAVRPESPKHHDFIGHIASSGRHLLQLINDVLDLSKVEAGKFEFHAEPLDLARLVGEVCAVLHPAALAKRLRIDAQVDDALDDIVLDPARLKQVLYNYLSNAIKFSAPGQRIAVRALPAGPTRFRIEVQDHGIGIAAADLPRLFNEFQQLDSGTTKRHPGTGLGLALTRRLVQAQGGSVGVVSEPGVGSTFHLVLNRVHGSDAGAAAQQARPQAQRLLVIEDDAPLQSRMVDGLARAGYGVDAASTGEEALRRAFGQNYDGITLDLVLPDRRGLALLASIRGHGPSRDSPVLGMSMPDSAGSSASFAIANVLGKPIRTEEVAAAMAHFQRRHPQRARVMVVDDDLMARELMRSTLEAIGLDVVCVEGGREALATLGQHRPDAMVLDLMMPEFDGFAVLDALHALPAWRDLPVYVWTSLVLSDAEYEDLARSARAVLNKGGGLVGPVLEALQRRRLPSSSVAREA